MNKNLECSFIAVFAASILILLNACAAPNNKLFSQIGIKPKEGASSTFVGDFIENPKSNPLYEKQGYIPCWQKDKRKGENCVQGGVLRDKGGFYVSLVMLDALTDSYYSLFKKSYCSVTNNSFITSHQNQPALLKILSEYDYMSYSYCITGLTSLTVLRVNTTTPIQDEMTTLLEGLLLTRDFADRIR